VLAAGVVLAAPRSPISGYTGWTKVNPEPHFLASFLCRVITPAEVVNGPLAHRDSAITVFVNDHGRDAMLKQAHPRFPVGTVIVKEKRVADVAKGKPRGRLLMTVMEKKAGENGGTWEYSAYDEKGRRMEGVRTQQCQSCHEKVRADDFVFRDYLPKSARLSLK
jgi:hypothetical protein